MPLLTKIRRIQRYLFDWTVQHHPGLDLEGRAEFFVQRFERHLPKSAQVLDIGGSWGFYGAPLEQRGHQYTVLDVVKPAFHRAPVVLYSPGEKFPLPDRSFDASLIITVLHHIDDPESVLREAVRVTRGIVVVIEDLYHHPVGRWWTKLRDQIYNFEYFGHPGQFRSREEWLATFKKLGLELIEDQKVYTWLSGLRILNGIFILRVPAR